MRTVERMNLLFLLLLVTTTVLAGPTTTTTDTSTDFIISREAPVKTRVSIPDNGNADDGVVLHVQVDDVGDEVVLEEGEMYLVGRHPTFPNTEMRWNI